MVTRLFTLSGLNATLFALLNRAKDSPEAKLQKTRDSQDAQYGVHALHCCGGMRLTAVGD